MSASLSLSGLRELVKALDVLPQGLEDKAAQATREIAFETADVLRSELPKSDPHPLWSAGGIDRSYQGGNLRKRVRVKRQDTTRYQVISGAPHAWINEYGTARRQNKKRANRGISPPSKVVGRVASQQRRKYNAALEQVLVQVLGTVK